MQTQIDSARLAAEIINKFPADVLRDYIANVPEDYSQYQDNPVGYCESVFNEKYTDDVKKIMESVRDNIITIAQSANGTGKTHCAARIAAWFFDVFADSQVYTAAAGSEDNLKKLLWGEIGSLIEKHPKVFSKYRSNVLHLQRGPKSFLTGVPIPTTGTEAMREARFSGKHAPHLLFILDEGDAIPDEVYKGIESCMSGGHVRLLILFNPRAEVGPVYQMIRDCKANVVKLSAFSHPNVITGENLFDGAVSRGITARRINQWSRKLQPNETITNECFQLPEFLVGVTALSQKGTPYPPLVAGWYIPTNPAFSYMVLGEYPAQAENQLISKEWTSAARARWDMYVAKFGEVPPRNVQGIMGVDPAGYGVDMTECCFRYGGWVEKFVSWNGVDALVTGDRASELYHSKPIRCAVVDTIGLGFGVAPHMRRLRCNAHGFETSKSATKETELGKFGLQRDQILWATREWLRTDTGSMLPPDEELLEELHTVTYSIINGKVKVMSKDVIKELIKRSPGKLDALALTHAEIDAPVTPFVYKPRQKVKYPW